MSLYLDDEVGALSKEDQENNKIILIAQSTENEFIFLDKSDYNGNKCIENKYEDVLYMPIPYVDAHDRECIMIIGKSGSGKSTFAATYVRQYTKLFPDSPIYLFSKGEVDPVLDSIPGMNRINIAGWNLEQYGDLRMYENSIIIFDDIDMLYDVAKKDQIIKFRNSILEDGRKLKIYAVITKHQFPRGRHEKVLNVECRSIVFFPQSNKAEIDDFLNKQLLMKKSKRKRVMETDSRWIMYVNENPEYCITEHLIYTID
jgi:energy-coupling factor transporter ATP-binding protein EcfA2